MVIDAAMYTAIFQGGSNMEYAGLNILVMVLIHLAHIFKAYGIAVEIDEKGEKLLKFLRLTIS